ncbi:DUF1697 domain-containing protein [Streptomyces sp. NPDC058440]|uniref:DUF1697 domain-containing protein n=1 Tax=Streptomyces sp. NPDC058440 TaxID=3346501 RepID=UPI00365207FC
MTKYVALLRGVNVGGRAKIAMKDLRELFGEMGFDEVQTYLQSGDVVFADPAGAAPGELRERIEKRLSDGLGVPAGVLLRTGESPARTVAANPYLDREDDPTKLHVTFLAERAAALQTPAAETAEFTLVGDEIHLHVPGGYGRTKLNNTFIERRLGIAATTRNWKSVNALHELAS